MSIFDRYDVVLVQFREPGQTGALAGLEVSEESSRASEERHKKNAARSPMTELIQRNGASFRKVRKRLARSGFELDRAHAQVRESAHHKLHTLVTFVFRKDGKKASGELEELFAVFARRRYEYVRASQGADYAGKPMLSLLAKTTAREAVELQKVDDGDASAYGIVVTKAVRKENRGQETVQTAA